MPTTTPGQDFPVPVSTDDPNIPDDMLTLATAIEKRVVGVYTSSTDRSTRVPTPQEGQFAYMADTNTFAYFNGSSWVGFPTPVPAITSGTAAPNNADGADGDVYFKV